MAWGRYYPGLETPITLDGPDVLDAVIWRMELGQVVGDGSVECVGLLGGVYQTLSESQGQRVQRMELGSR